jgi:hypothetical protein
LFAQRAIDAEALLDRLEFEGREQILERMKAGPLGDLFTKLGEIGTPPGILQGIQVLAQLDPKMFERAKEQGKIPTFMQWIQQFIAEQQGQPAPQPTDPAAEADAILKAEQAKKVQADTALTMEQINTEKVNQARLQAGIALDQEVLKIKRAEAVAGMVQGHHEAVLSTAETATNIAATHHDEKLKADKTAADIHQGQVDGIKSDNKEK